MKMEENNKHVQPNSKEEGVQRLNRILSESLIKATDTYKTPPQIIWVDNSSIATLGNFSASTGKAKAKKTFNVSALVAASLSNGKVLNYRANSSIRSISLSIGPKASKLSSIATIRS